MTEQKEAAAFAKQHEAEQLLSMQIDDFKGEEIDPDNEPDLYLPLSAAKVLHEALSTQATALATARAEAEALRSEVERLRALLDGVASFLDVAPLGSGVCCCGDPIEGHSYYSGHSPVDQASYTAGLWAKDIRTALGERL